MDKANDRIAKQRAASSKHIDDVLNEIRVLFEKAAVRIDSLQYKERVVATTLAEELGKEIGLSGPTFYPTLLWLIKSYPNRVTRKGAYGGVWNLIDPAAEANQDGEASPVEEKLETSVGE